MVDSTWRILLLGGTGLALKLARTLWQQGYQLTYSIAGLVRQPDLPCHIVSGGFTQFGGMAAYIRTHRINLIIDVTHPYAAQISQHAVTAAADCGISCWRLQRPAWEAVAGDRWFTFTDWKDLLPALRGYQCVFLSQGRLSAEQLQQLAAQRQPGQQFYLRTAVKPEQDFPIWLASMQAIGPFDLTDELALFRRLGIDVLVSKNSGGGMTMAKLQAARELSIPVLLLQRPELARATHEFTDMNSLLTAL